MLWQEGYVIATTIEPNFGEKKKEKKKEGFVIPKFIEPSSFYA